jgi:hypothetical protein
MVFGARFSKWRYYVELVFFTGVARVKVLANVDFFPIVTLRGQNYSFSCFPKENLFNYVLDNGARMLALCKLRSDEKTNDRGNLQTNFEAQNKPFRPGEGSLWRLRLCTGYNFKFWARFNTFK